MAEARALEDGEFYMHELVGLSVATAAGASIGVVAQVIEAPQGWLLEVAGEQKRHLIPFTRGVVQRVDRTERVMVIAPPNGLLEL
jgi:16S rRNA processing protein RimM